MPNLLLGNPLQSYNDGVQTGQNNRFNALAGQAIAAPADQQSGLIAQAAQADPAKALALKGTLTQQADTDEDRRNKTLVNMSRLLVSVPDAQKDQIYQQIRPSLAGLGLTQAPANYNDEIGQTAKSIVDAYTPINAQPVGLRETQGDVAAAGLTGDDAKKAYRIKLGVDPRAVTGAAKTGMITGADGRERPFTFDPSTQQYKVFDGQAFRPLDQTEAAQLGSGGQVSAPAAAAPRVSADDLMRQATQMANKDGPGKNADQAQAWLNQQLVANGYKTAPAGTSVPQTPSPVGGLGVGRAPEDTAGAVQNAKNASDLSYLPAQENVKVNAAVDQAGRTAVATNQAKNAAEQAQQVQQKTQDAHQVIGLLDEADKILPQATGSGAGRAIDSAAATFGKSTAGAQATAQLQAIAGRLTSSVPRMQGPQSDSDVRLYQQMAGDLANPDLPVATRQAASKTIRQLQMKYLDNPMGNNTVISAPYASQAPAPAAAGGNFSHLWSK